ncbi:TolB family protein [Umezawaea beigongshangensis]|uniref:TolB family protein n=1 Tax=Umezawaea beigongshangensis TaxID=2780383 RepID=UPI0018F23FD4|nr:hypothetical protein [Umezawaea beigongshangensis]
MRAWLLAHRTVVGVVVIALVVLAGGGYVASVAVSARSAAAPVTAAVTGDLLFVEQDDGRSRVEKAALADPGGPRGGTPWRCQRVYAAGGTTACLRLAGPGPSYEAAIVDDGGREVRTVPLPGTPSRARVSASGNVVSWTTFVSGDSYLVAGGFSTRTGVLDLRSGELVESLEGFTSTVDGVARSAEDRNFWGVTVAADDRTFYATMSSGGRTWLVEGDLAARTTRTVRPGAECPSLSPDGTRVAYKKRTDGRLGPWELVVLDLTTDREHSLPGTGGVDDQAVWLDDATLAYGKAAAGQKPSIYRVPADGSAGPELLVPHASSPVPVR